MKKSLLGAIVIIFVICVSILVLTELNETTVNEVQTQQYYADND